MRLFVLAMFMIPLPLTRSALAEHGINIGLGLDYTPVVKLQYLNNPELDFDVFDNIAWQGRLSYNFGNGFRSGFIFDYYKKKIHPGPFTTIDLSMWETGVYGDYAYEITESGHTLISGGMETGYGMLGDKSDGASNVAGSVWIGGLVGARFLIAGKIWLDIQYRLIWQEFAVSSEPERTYKFSGPSLRFSLEYPIYTKRDKTED